MNAYRSALNPWAWRPIAVCGLLYQMACTEGYPTTDELALKPSQMSQSQLIEALNRLGARPHLSQRWRYALEPGCQLVIQATPQGPPATQVVPLVGVLIETDSVDDDTSIRLTPKGKLPADAVTVLVTSKWTDTAFARSLLAHLGRSCVDNMPAAS